MMPHLNVSSSHFSRTEQRKPAPHAMTVDGFDMKVASQRGVPAVTRRDAGGTGENSGNNGKWARSAERGRTREQTSSQAPKNDPQDEPWMALADLRDGQRESWMSDRAKHDFGTVKLASVYLEEEKNRIIRLRKIKSVLASENYMGTTAPSKNINSHNRRRPRPNTDVLHRAVGHAHRRRQGPQPRVAPPNYHTRAFGNVVPLLQAGPTAPRDLENKDDSNQMNRGSRYDYTCAAHCLIGSFRDESARHGIPTRLKLTALQSDGGSHPFHGTAADAGDGRACSRQDIQDIQQPGGVFSADSNGSQLKLHSRSCGKKVTDDSRMSSGASAIDLFDQCGLVPAAAVEFAGLVGTSREESQGSINNSHVGSADDNREIIAVPASVKPPLPPGASVGIRGRQRRQRSLGNTNDSAKESNFLTNTHRVGGISDKKRTPYLGGTDSVKSRASQVHGKPRDANVDDGNKFRREIGGGGIKARLSRDASPGCQDDATPAGVLNYGVVGVTPRDASPNGESSARVRRRWSNASRCGSESHDDKIEFSSSRGKDGGGERGRVKGEGGDEVAVASSQRIASAQARLHKGKDLAALKSEHIEALSILKDISAPSSADAHASVSGEERNEDRTLKPFSNDRFEQNMSAAHEPTNSLKNRETMAQKHGPVDTDVDSLSANLPRIGSREQAALRALYRKWWVQIAENGVGPPPATPDALEMTKAGLITCAPVTEIDASVTDHPSVRHLEGKADNDGKKKISKSYSVFGESAANAPRLEECAGSAAVVVCDSNGNASMDAGVYQGDGASSKHRTTGLADLSIRNRPQVAEDDMASDLDQQQHESDVETVLGDERLTPAEEEGLHGRIYLPDGRFVSTHQDHDKAIEVGGDEGVYKDPTVSDTDDSSEYEGEQFET